MCVSRTGARAAAWLCGLPGGRAVSSISQRDVPFKEPVGDKLPEVTGASANRVRSQAGTAGSSGRAITQFQGSQVVPKPVNRGIPFRTNPFGQPTPPPDGLGTSSMSTTRTLLGVEPRYRASPLGSESEPVTPANKDGLADLQGAILIQQLGHLGTGHGDSSDSQNGMSSARCSCDWTYAHAGQRYQDWLQARTK
jgi:hypothetical protein